jgi:hypothetical protein
MNADKFAKYLPLVYLGAAGIAVYFVYRAVKGVGNIGGGVIDSIAQPVADLWIRLTQDEGVKLADGITYVLPSGERITPDKAEILSGGRFKYMGNIYRLVEATPPGSGVYRAERAS